MELLAQTCHVLYEVDILEKAKKIRELERELDVYRMHDVKYIKLITDINSFLHWKQHFYETVNKCFSDYYGTRDFPDIIQNVISIGVSYVFSSQSVIDRTISGINDNVRNLRLALQFSECESVNHDDMKRIGANSLKGHFHKLFMNKMYVVCPLCNQKTSPSRCCGNCNKVLIFICRDCDSKLLLGGTCLCEHGPNIEDGVEAAVM